MIVTTGIVNCQLAAHSMAQKLHYFNISGLAEPIRYILLYSGQQFEDIRYERQDWPVKEIKDSK